MIADRRADRLEARLRTPRRRRPHASPPSSATSSVEHDVERLMETAVSTFGRLDVLVNNAGVFSNFLLEHMQPEEFNRIIGVNVGGAFLCIRAAAARMREQGDGGSIVNITSIDAIHPSGSGLSHYGTSKHAIWGLTKTMALELGPDGIRVNAVAPGPVADGGRGRVRRGRRAGGDRRGRAVGRLRGANSAATSRASRRRRARDALPRLRPRRRT